MIYLTIFSQAGHGLLGSIGIGGAIGFGLNKLIGNATRSRQEKQIDEANATKSTIEAARDLINLGAEEVKVRAEKETNAWQSVSKLEGIIEDLTADIDNYRERLAHVSAELSEVKLELIREREQRQLAEHQRDRFKKVAKDIIIYIKEKCPNIISQFKEDYGPLGDEFLEELR